MRPLLIKTGMAGLLLLLSPLSVAAEDLSASVRGSDKLLVALSSRDERIGFVRTTALASRTRFPATNLVSPLKRAQLNKTVRAKKEVVTVEAARRVVAQHVSSRERRRLYFEKVNAKSGT